VKRTSVSFFTSPVVGSRPLVVVGYVRKSQRSSTTTIASTRATASPSKGRGKGAPGFAVSGF
jgi:hypothetical protein